jgi:hypothetical protein
MMNSKNIFNFFISTYIAFLNHISSYHHFSNCRICGFEKRFFLFVNAKFRTINSLFTRTIIKRFIAMFAKIFNRTSSDLRAMITLSRTIFCFIASRRNMCESFRTYCTISFYSNCIAFIFTFTRAIFECFQSKSRNIQSCFAIQTFNIMRFYHAAP